MRLLHTKSNFTTVFPGDLLTTRPTTTVLAVSSVRLNVRARLSPSCVHVESCLLFRIALPPIMRGEQRSQACRGDSVKPSCYQTRMIVTTNLAVSKHAAPPNWELSFTVPLGRIRNPLCSVDLPVLHSMLRPRHALLMAHSTNP